MKNIRIILLALTVLAFFTSVHAQSDAPFALVMKAEGPIAPVMREYLKRGIASAEQQNAEVLIIELNTPGGDLGTTVEIIQAFRASNVPVIIYVTPNGAMAGSAGAIISMAAHGIAMAPEAAIGAASPIDSSGNDLNQTLQKKAKNIIKAQIRPLVTPRGAKALALADAMIDDAKAATAQETPKTY
jgi:membrane-bound serine protease (ClpP class)